MDFGCHFCDFLERGRHQKFNDIHANIEISADLRTQKTGQKNGCKTSGQTGVQKLDKWRPGGSILGAIWSLFGISVASQF